MVVTLHQKTIDSTNFSVFYNFRIRQLYSTCGIPTNVFSFFIYIYIYIGGECNKAIANAAGPSIATEYKNNARGKYDYTVCYFFEAYEKITV